MAEPRRVVGARVRSTGAASGIGETTARLLHADGARLALLDRDRDALERVAGTLDARAVVANVADADAVRSGVEEAAEAIGGLDHLVNNAGTGSLARLEDYSDRDLDRLIAVNLTGAYRVLAAALPHLRSAPTGRGSVVNVASASGVRPTLGEAPYSAAKAGLISLTRSAAMEAAPEVRVNCVSPGFVATPLNRMLLDLPGIEDTLSAATPLGRVGSAEEVARVIAFLLSDDASYIAGQNLVVDGGSLLPNPQVDPVLGPLLG